MNKNYDDIIDLPHHVSKVRKQMPLANRAAQFAPFAALTGHEGALAETARHTDSRIELADDEKLLLSKRLAEAIEHRLTVSVTYFSPDKKKSGGAYITAVAAVKRIDEFSAKLVLENGITIALADITDIKIPDNTSCH